MRSVCPRLLWAGSLRSLFPSLYANRPVFLVKALIGYLEETAGNSDGSFICGVKNISAVWEHMPRKVILEVEEGWNSRLPKAWQYSTRFWLWKKSSTAYRFELLCLSGQTGCFAAVFISTGFSFP